MTINWSAIIPTLNRADSLRRTLQSLVTQSCSPQQYEIIVVDNGSTDNTKDVVESFITNYPQHNIKYFYDAIPGLLTGRHRGLTEARSDILTFFDDDVTVNKDFANTVTKVFSDEAIVIAGGPSYPEYEVEPPEWIEHYWHTSVDGIKSCPSLSLMDAGQQTRFIDPIYIWGLDFSIRKNTLIDLGGFAPDCYPDDLFILIGDGECAVTKKLQEQGIQAFYHPTLSVIHHTSSSRITEAYFHRRRLYEGIGASYTHIRSGEMGQHIPLPRHSKEGLDGIHDRIYNSYVVGYLRHHVAATSQPPLMEWVLRDEYITDLSLPELNPENPISIELLLNTPIDKIEDPTLRKFLQLATKVEQRRNVLWRRIMRFVRKAFFHIGLGSFFDFCINNLKKFIKID